MNTTHNKNQINRIVNTLISAYRIQPNTLVSINDSVQEENCQQGIEDWVHRSLLNPDEQLAECILPILVDRFEAHLNNYELTNDK